ncbi:hypothetical protein D4Q52_22700 [Rhodopseudomonas palustris]|uniref:Uncharacterized protein n=2 Tax=Rhodopseudomonas palustris TaxID=1076 RepID=A0A418UYR0_RHOPL|nr:hypothetical protein D4Q52_22700 [Rhodopseudomonas palustris]
MRIDGFLMVRLTWSYADRVRPAIAKFRSGDAWRAWRHRTAALCQTRVEWIGVRAAPLEDGLSTVPGSERRRCRTLLTRAEAVALVIAVQPTALAQGLGQAMQPGGRGISVTEMVRLSTKRGPTDAQIRAALCDLVRFQDRSGVSRVTQKPRPRVIARG